MNKEWFVTRFADSLIGRVKNLPTWRTKEQIFKSIHELERSASTPVLRTQIGVHGKTRKNIARLAKVNQKIPLSIKERAELLSYTDLTTCRIGMTGKDHSFPDGLCTPTKERGTGYISRTPGRLLRRGCIREFNFDASECSLAIPHPLNTLLLLLSGLLGESRCGSPSLKSSCLRGATTVKFIQSGANAMNNLPPGGAQEFSRVTYAIITLSEGIGNLTEFIQGDVYKSGFFPLLFLTISQALNLSHKVPPFYSCPKLSTNCLLSKWMCAPMAHKVHTIQNIVGCEALLENDFLNPSSPFVDFHITLLLPSTSPTPHYKGTNSVPQQPRGCNRQRILNFTGSLGHIPSHRPFRRGTDNG